MIFSEKNIFFWIFVKNILWELQPQWVAIRYIVELLLLEGKKAKVARTVSILNWVQFTWLQHFWLKWLCNNFWTIILNLRPQWAAVVVAIRYIVELVES